jgi:zinc protease
MSLRRRSTARDTRTGTRELGTEAAVRGITRDDMLAFWKQNFVPNNARWSSPEHHDGRAARLAEKAFGAWPRGTPVTPALGSADDDPGARVIVDKPGSPQTQVRVASIGCPPSPDFRRSRS